MKTFASWLRRWWSGFSPRAPRQAKHAKLRIRPLLEQLEDRLTPAFLFVSADSRIIRFDMNGSATVFAAEVNFAAGLAFDSAGNLYVASETTNTIRRFSPAGVDLGNFATTGLNGPVGLAFDSAGNLYAANGGNDTIRRFSPTGVDLGNFATSGLKAPYGLAFDSAGNLYVTNAYKTVDSVRRFSPAGIDLGNFASTGLDLPTGLAFDAAGNLYVGNSEAPNIRRFSPTGVDLGDFVITPFNAAEGLAFDSAGNLYVVMHFGTVLDSILKFSPAGVDLGNLPMPLANPRFLAFYPQEAPQAPTVEPPAGQSSAEGAAHTFSLGSFTDPDGGRWSVDVDWGDRTAHTIFSMSSPGTITAQRHVYAEEGSYALTVKVTDTSDGQFDFKTFTVNVGDPAEHRPRDVGDGLLGDDRDDGRHHRDGHANGIDAPAPPPRVSQLLQQLQGGGDIGAARGAADGWLPLTFAEDPTLSAITADDFRWIDLVVAHELSPKAAGRARSGVRMR